MIINKFKKKCQSCNDVVDAGNGFAYKNGYTWLTVCKSTACMKRLGLTPPETNQEKAVRELNAEGVITMPFDRAALPLLRSMPGKKFDPNTKKWKVSTAPEDIKRVLELADRLELNVAEELRSKAQIDTDELKQAKERINNQPALYSFQKEGIEFLALKNKAILADDQGLGKAQPVDADVLTPNGWVKIGSLNIGDLVIGSDGKETKVIGIFPQGKKDIFEISTSDGRKTRCCDEHLWTVQPAWERSRNPDRWVVKTTNELKNDLKFKSNDRKWYLPVVAPIVFKEKELLIDPYLMGALLANGSFRSGSIKFSGSKDQVKEIIPFIPDGLVIQQKRKYEYIIKQEVKGYINILTRVIKSFNLLNKHSYNKFIPEAFLNGSVMQRISLLQGLLDNDGTIAKDGMHIEYNTTSKVMAKQIVSLIRSLGGIARLRTRVPKFTYNNEIKIGKTDYRISVKIPSNICPFRLPRKKDRFVAPSKYQVAIGLENIKHIGIEECVCIKVESDDCLYVTDDYILTHNTIQILTALPEQSKSIVVCPASLKYNWQKECEKWRPDLKPIVLNGRNSFVFPEESEIVILNYDILPDWLLLTKTGEKNFRGKDIKKLVVSDEYKSKLKEIRVIGDEVQLVKKYSTKRAEKYTSLCKLAKSAWGLTGTPLENKPQDLYGVCSSNNINVFGSWNSFLNLFNAVPNGFGGYVWGDPSPEVPERLANVMLRRLKKDVWKEMPQKSYKYIDINLTNKESSEINKLTKELVESIGLENIDDLPYDLILSNKSLPSFKLFSKIRKKLALIKIPAALEIVESYEESEEPLIVFSYHKAPVEKIGSRDGWAYITGDTNPKDRQRIVDDFQAGKLKGVACTIKAAGVGLTLTKACNVLFIDLDWIPGANIQAEDRAHRIGQLKNVLYMYLCTDNALDQHVHNLIKRKLEIIKKALESSLTFKKPEEYDSPELIEETEEELKQRIANAEKDAEEQLAKSKIHSILGREIARSQVPEPDLNPERKKLIRNALSYMVGRCDMATTRDGLGFNKPDAAIAHWIFRTGMHENDDITYRVTERILSRYNRQLRDSFSEIWKPVL